MPQSNWNWYKTISPHIYRGSLTAPPLPMRLRTCDGSTRTSVWSSRELSRKPATPCTAKRCAKPSLRKCTLSTPAIAAKNTGHDNRYLAKVAVHEMVPED